MRQATFRLLLGLSAAVLLLDAQGSLLSELLVVNFISALTWTCVRSLAVACLALAGQRPSTLLQRQAPGASAELAAAPVSQAVAAASAAAAMAAAAAAAAALPPPPSTLDPMALADFEAGLDGALMAAVSDSAGGGLHRLLCNPLSHTYCLARGYPPATTTDSAPLPNTPLFNHASGLHENDLVDEAEIDSVVREAILHTVGDATWADAKVMGAAAGGF